MLLISAAWRVSLDSRGFDRRTILFASGGAALAGAFVATAGPARADDENGRGRNFTSSRLSTKYQFNDPDMDLFFLVALGWGPTGGLSVGEAYYVASTIQDGDADSWVASFAEEGDRQNQLADSWRSAGSIRESAQARMKAFVSYRSAWQFAALGQSFDSLYQRHQVAFRTAMADSGLPATFFDAPYKGKTLPGLFIQGPPDAPVVVLFGGADTCFEEIYLTVGRNLLDAGYSIAMADLPGQGNTMQDGLHWEAAPEIPIAAIIDVLEARFGAQPGRMALLAYSLGGYWATRAAAFEDRVATVIASTPLPRPGELFAAALQDYLANPPADGGQAAQRNYAALCWKAGVANVEEMPAKARDFVADPSLVTVPFLSIVGAAEGEQFQKQSDEWHAQIRSSNKKLVRLDAWTGGDGHVQAGNRLRLAQETTTWLTPIFNA